MAAVAISYKSVYFTDLLAAPAAVDFLQIHAENFMGAGGAPHAQLTKLSAELPLSIHGVGLSLGAAHAPDDHHLQRLRTLFSRYESVRFSEHLAWSSHGPFWLPDLLPLAYDEQTLRRVHAHIDHAQSVLGRQLLIENPSTYLPISSPLEEVDFLRELVKRSGCGLLLDITNAVVSCHNHGSDVIDYLRRFPLEAVQEIHLAGHNANPQTHDASLWIDDHGGKISEVVLAQYAAVISQHGPIPTVIEWDNNLPTWAVLKHDVCRVRNAASVARPLPALAA